MGGRDLFQGDKAATAHQVLYKREQERRDDTDMDGIDNNTGHRAMTKYKWHLPNLVAFIGLNLFVKVDLQKWLDNPFEDRPATKEKVVQGVLF